MRSFQPGTWNQLMSLSNFSPPPRANEEAAEGSGLRPGVAEEEWIRIQKISPQPCWGRPEHHGRTRAPPPMVLGASWQLVAKHRSGSLENAVGELRNRNLAISFGTLLLLGIAGAMIIVWAERVRAAADGILGGSFA